VRGEGGCTPVPPASGVCAIGGVVLKRVGGVSPNNGGGLHACCRLL